MTAENDGLLLKPGTETRNGTWDGTWNGMGYGKSGTDTQNKERKYTMFQLYNTWQ